MSRQSGYAQGMAVFRAEQSLSLKQWFYRHARLPILISILAIVAVESLLLAIMGKHQLELQEGVANRLAEFSRLALFQGSTPLLQAGFDIAIRDLRASRAFVCEQGWVLVLKEPQRSSCAVEPRVGYRVLRVPIAQASEAIPKFGQHFEFVLQAPIFPQESLIYYTLGFSIGVCVLGMFLLRRLGSRLEKDLFIPLFKNLSSQMRLPIRELEILRQKLSQLNRLRTQEAVASAVVSRNLQVAHDIRSPLTALVFASKDFDLLPDSTRKVIRSAVSRITAIVDSLSETKKTKTMKPESPLLETINETVFEKKVEYQNRLGVDWQLELSGLPATSMAPMDSQVLRRVLSNLINNSVEALPGFRGKVEVGARQAGPEIQIWVEDSGKGFPFEFSQRLGQSGFTFGKAEGKGLGLSHAFEAVRAAQGILQLKPAQSGVGTRAELKFPITQ